MEENRSGVEIVDCIPDAVDGAQLDVRLAGKQSRQVRSSDLLFAEIDVGWWKWERIKRR